MNVIEAVGLTKRYGTKVAVDGISFSVERGQVFGFLGPNGSGKTTTMAMLLGVIAPSAGTFRLFGQAADHDAQAARRRIGATVETPNAYQHLSAFDNLRIVANIKRTSHSQIEPVLARLGLSRSRDTVRTYSLGMKQRLALAAALVGDPDLIILDEPTNGLDPEGMQTIRMLIRELAEAGKTIFLSSHLLGEVERICTHVAIISRGRIVRQTSVSALTGNSSYAAIEAQDMVVLERAVEAYPGTQCVTRTGGTLLVQLAIDDLAALNRYLAGHGIHVSHLARQAPSLEQVYMESSEPPQAGPE